MKIEKRLDEILQSAEKVLLTWKIKIVLVLIVIRGVWIKMFLFNQNQILFLTQLNNNYNTNLTYI